MILVWTLSSGYLQGMGGIEQLSEVLLRWETEQQRNQSQMSRKIRELVSGYTWAPIDLSQLIVIKVIETWSKTSGRKYDFDAPQQIEQFVNYGRTNAHAEDLKL